MTVIQPNSIAGINSITAQGDTLTLYKSNGTTIGQLNVNINASSGVSTVNNLIANGNVGIGTTNPTQPLSVNGNAYVSGNIAVGTTSSTGTNSNVAPVIAGNHVSFTGSVSAATGTATTLFSLNNLNSSYIVSAFITGTSDAANYVAMYMVGSVTTNSHVISAIKAGGLLTLTLSGANVQATQSSGTTQTITWSVTRMANV